MGNNWEVSEEILICFDGTVEAGHIRCPVCGKSFPYKYKDEWNYCPNCGAPIERTKNADKRL